MTIKCVGRSRQAGFTLVEITIAVAILSVALITLLGLQSASVERTMRDRNALRAMMIARRVLSAIETSPDSPDIQDEQGSARDILKKTVPIDSDVEEDEEALDMFNARFQVEYWDLPNIEPQSVKRVTLSVAWTEDPRDVFEVVYFIAEDVPIT